MKIAIASGKGGTGKTFLSTNLFTILEEKGKKISLVDCDVEEPNVQLFLKGKLSSSQVVEQNLPVIDTDKCTFCGLCHEYCSFNAIMFIKPLKYIKVTEELCHDCGACSYACKFGAITEKKKELGKVNIYLSEKKNQIVEGKINIGIFSGVRVIKEAINTVINNPLVILDAPPGTSCPFVATVGYADYVILITEPTHFGLNDLQLAVDTVRGMNKPIGVVINRAKEGTNPVKEYLEKEKIDLIAEIPYQREIAEIYSKGSLLVKEKAEYTSVFSDVVNKIEELINERNSHN